MYYYRIPEADNDLIRTSSKIFSQYVLLHSTTNEINHHKLAAAHETWPSCFASWVWTRGLWAFSFTTPFKQSETMSRGYGNGTDLEFIYRKGLLFTPEFGASATFYPRLLRLVPIIITPGGFHWQELQTRGIPRIPRSFKGTP